MASEEGYQGWRDHATWAVALHIGQERDWYEHWAGRARALLAAHGDLTKARWQLEDEMREWFDLRFDQFFERHSSPYALMLQDLIPRGGQIDWRAIADAQFPEEE